VIQGKIWTEIKIPRYGPADHPEQMGFQKDLYLGDLEAFTASKSITAVRAANQKWIVSD